MPLVCESAVQVSGHPPPAPHHHHHHPPECRNKERSRKEGNVLFNDAFNTFYLRLYGVGDMVEDHSDSERGNSLPPQGLLFPISSKVLLYAPSHRQDSTYHGLCYTSRGALAGTRRTLKERCDIFNLCDVYTYINGGLTGNCGRIGVIGSSPSNGLKPYCETKLVRPKLI